MFCFKIYITYKRLESLKVHHIKKKQKQINMSDSTNNSQSTAIMDKFILREIDLTIGDFNWQKILKKYDDQINPLTLFTTIRSIFRILKSVTTTQLPEWENQKSERWILADPKDVEFLSLVILPALECKECELPLMFFAFYIKSMIEIKDESMAWNTLKDIFGYILDFRMICDLNPQNLEEIQFDQFWADIIKNIIDSIKKDIKFIKISDQDKVQNHFNFESLLDETLKNIQSVFKNEIKK